MSKLPTRAPEVTFHTRVRDESIGGDNPYRWEEVTTDQMFRGREVLVFSLPGAFTPTCSTYQLPDFERLHSAFFTKGLEDVYCVSVNDSFVMNKWAKDQGIKKVRMVPDGSGDFTKGMGMLVEKHNLGFGLRSWRYAAIIKDGEITKWFIEPGKENNCDDDPYGETDPVHILENI